MTEVLSAPSRRIMAIWLARLAIDRWRQNRQAPEGEGADQTPLALIAETAHGLRIAAANTAGLEAGARPGMMLADARALCPALATAPSDPASDLMLLEKLALWAQRWGPWSAMDPPDGLLVDVTGAAHLFGGEARLLADARGLLAGRGFAARLAIAPTAGAAWALAHYGAEGAILPGTTRLSHIRPNSPDPFALSLSKGCFSLEPGTSHKEKDSASTSSAQTDLEYAIALPAGGGLLDELPVAALRLDPDVLILLRRLGLKRIGDLAGIQRDALARRFRTRRAPAANPLVRLDQLLGRTPEPLLPVVAHDIPMVQRRLLEPVRHRALLDRVVADLAEALVRVLESRALGARRLELGLWKVDGEVLVRHLELASSSRDPGHIAGLFGRRLDDIDAGFGIELARLRAPWTERLTLSQADLEAAAEAHGTSLAACIDRLTVRLGEAAVRRPAPHASHMPERAQRWIGPLEPEGTSQGELALHARPLKLLDRAEPIAVLYASPDGLPRRFRWRGTVHDVARAEGPERIAPEWWRERSSARLRDYYRIEDGEGRRYWIYRAGLAGDGRGGAPKWFLQGLCG